jgi:hypothetical protein
VLGDVRADVLSYIQLTVLLLVCFPLAKGKFRDHLNWNKNGQVGRHCNKCIFLNTVNLLNLLITCHLVGSGEGREVKIT